MTWKKKQNCPGDTGHSWRKRGETRADKRDCVHCTIHTSIKMFLCEAAPHTTNIYNDNSKSFFY